MVSEGDYGWQVVRLSQLGQLLQEVLVAEVDSIEYPDGKYGFFVGGEAGQPPTKAHFSVAPSVGLVPRVVFPFLRSVNGVQEVLKVLGW